MLKLIFFYSYTFTLFLRFFLSLTKKRKYDNYDHNNSNDSTVW